MKSTLKLPTAEIEIEIRNKNGKLLELKRFPAKSFVGNFLALLSCVFKGGAMTSYTTGTTYYCVGRNDPVNIGGSNIGLTFFLTGTGSVYAGCEAPAGSDVFGMQVGSGDTPVTMTQYSLQTKISHGTGSGQLLYGASTVEALTKDTTWYFRVIRAFTNNTGASVTVKEIGLVVQFAAGANNTYTQFMVARDVLPSPVSIPDGAALTIRYKIQYSLT
jgi:hypothetical protein